MQIARIVFSIFSLITLPLFFSCGYGIPVHIAEPSERTEFDCISMITPSSGSWQYYSEKPYGHCDRLRMTGLWNETEEDLYKIYIVFGERINRPMTDDWDDELDNEYILSKAKKYIESEKKRFMGNEKIGMDYFNYELKTLDNIKDYCIEIKYEYSYSRQFSNHPTEKKGGHGRTKRGERKFLGKKLNPNDKYFSESIEFLVIEPQYTESAPMFARRPLSYRVIFRHYSLNEKRDPELEVKALEFLKKLEPHPPKIYRPYQVDIQKVEVE